MVKTTKTKQNICDTLSAATTNFIPMLVVIVL